MGHPRITYIVYTTNCILVILSLAFAMGFYTVGLKNSCEWRPSGRQAVGVAGRLDAVLRSDTALARGPCAASLRSAALTAVSVYDRLHALRAEEHGPRPLDYSIPDAYWRKRSIDYIIMMLWQSFALLFTYPSM